MRTPGIDFNQCLPLIMRALFMGWGRSKQKVSEEVLLIAPKPYLSIILGANIVHFSCSVAAHICSRLFTKKVWDR